jgi:hypothetical protein
MDEHVYYWAWAEEDNPGYSYFGGQNGKWYRVFKAGGKGTPVTEPMSREEAIDYCNRVVKLTGGRQI